MLINIALNENSFHYFSLVTDGTSVDYSKNINAVSLFDYEGRLLESGKYTLYAVSIIADIIFNLEPICNATLDMHNQYSFFIFTIENNN
jgi:hypothetical protein